MATKTIYKTKATAMKGARILLGKLQERIDKDPSKFCENYGQSEALDFESRLIDLHYNDACDVMAVLTRVMYMKPKL